MGLGWGGGIIIGSPRLAVGGLVHWFSSVGCSAVRVTQNEVSWFSVYLDLEGAKNV